MQVLSRMVYLDGIPYLDGGNSDCIPVDWAIGQGYEKIIVVKTHERGWRDPGPGSRRHSSGLNKGFTTTSRRCMIT